MGACTSQILAFCGAVVGSWIVGVSACPHVQFTSGVGSKRFPFVFVEQPGSSNGRPIWKSAEGYVLFHWFDGGSDGVAKWIVSNALNQPQGYAFVGSWALSVVDVVDVSPSSAWQVHDGKAWVHDADTRMSCFNRSADESFWLDSENAAHLEGAYIQTGTVWQGRRVFEHRRVWPSDAPAVFFYSAAGKGSDATSKWYFSHTVGDTKSFFAYCEGDQFGPRELFQTSSECRALYDDKEQKWYPASLRIVFGRKDADAPGWWSALQLRRNSAFNDLQLEEAATLRNGVRMPRVGTGTDDLTATELSTVLGAGARLLDTATINQNEGVVATAIDNHEQRAKLFLVSKVWHTELGFQATLDVIGRHMSELGTSYLDLSLIHWPECDQKVPWMRCSEQPNANGTWRQSWRALEKLYAEGRVRSIGISNFDYNRLWEALVQQYPHVQPHVIQNWFEPLQTDDAVRDLAQKHGVQYMGYSPLRNTMWNNHSAYDRVRDVAARIGTAIGRSSAQVLLRWMVEQDAVVIPRSKRVSHQQENMDLFGWQLSAAHSRTLSGLAWSRDTEL